jgi:hypothetical protein
MKGKSMDNVLAMVKEFFSTEEKPLVSSELVSFKRDDPKGFAQVRDGIVNGTLTY